MQKYQIVHEKNVRATTEPTITLLKKDAKQMWEGLAAVNAAGTGATIDGKLVMFYANDLEYIKARFKASQRNVLKLKLVQIE